MNRITRNIITLICRTTISLQATAKEAYDSLDIKKKAQYIFLEAVSKNAEDNTDASFDLMEYAHRLDPDNPAIAFYLGFMQVSVESPSENEVKKGLGLMRKITVERPDDYFENYVYAVICSSISQNAEAIRVLERLLKGNPEKISLYPILAKSYAMESQFDKAVAVIDSLEKSEGRSMNTTITKIQFLIADSDTADAIETGRRFLADAPNSAEPNTLMGELFSLVNRPDSALSYYDRALEIDPDYGFASLQKANLYYKLGDSLRYEREISSVLVNKNTDVNSKVEILRDYIRNSIQRNDTTQRVEKMFQTILEQHPHEAQLHGLFCDYLTFRQKYKAAAEQLTYTVDIDPSDPKNWEKLMWLHIYNHQPDKTISTGEKAQHFHPDHIAFLQILGIAHYQMKEYKKSIECYQTLLERNKEYQEVDEADIYTSLAESYHQVGDTAKVFECYDKALEINPESALSLNNYAYFLILSKPDDRQTLQWAEEMSALSIELEPDNTSCLDTYAWIMFIKRDYKTALEYIEKAVELRDTTGNNGELYEHYGDILFMLGRPEEALEQWEKALKDKPDSDLLKKKVENKTYFYE